MSAWRREALKLMPDCQTLIQRADSPMALWIDLHLKFEDAFRDASSAELNAILKYAEWCISQESGALPNDSSTAAVCAFYEHLPARKEFWPHMGNWLGMARLNELRNAFRYHLSEKEAKEFEAAVFPGMKHSGRR